MGERACSLKVTGVSQPAVSDEAGVSPAPSRGSNGAEREFPCFSLPHSPAGDVEAEVVFIGPGGPREFEEAGDIRGKAVIVTNEPSPGLGRMLHRSEKYGRAVKAGAAAFIYMRMGPMLAETGTVRHNETGAIPAVSITREAGMEMRRLMERGPVRIRVTTTDKAKPLTGWNIIGEIPGASSPEKDHPCRRPSGRARYLSSSRGQRWWLGSHPRGSAGLGEAQGPCAQDRAVCMVLPARK